MGRPTYESRGRHLRRLVAVLATLMAAWTIDAHAQCGSWVPGRESTLAAYPIQSITEWDPDGDGPAESVLVVSGVFGSIGATNLRFLAVWHGDHWSSIDAMGVTEAFLADAGAVECAAVVAGQLYIVVHRRVSATTSASVHRWDGIRWEQLGPAFGAAFPSVRAVARILDLGGAPVIMGVSGNDDGPWRGPAAWDGAHWRSLAPMNLYFTSVSVWNGRLVGSTSTGAWLRDGQVWTRLGANAISAVGSGQGQLYGIERDGDADSVVRWDGVAWQAVGSPLSASMGWPGVKFHALDDGLFVQSASGLIARFDGTHWPAIAGRPSFDFLGAAIGPASAWRGKLVWGVAASHDDGTRDLATWDAGRVRGLTDVPNWSILGGSRIGTSLFVAGQFWHVDGQLTYGDAVRTDHSWNVSFSPIGIPDDYPPPVLSAGGDGVVIYGLDYLEGHAFDGLAYFDGARWSAFPRGNRQDIGAVSAITELDGGLVVAAHDNWLYPNVRQKILRWNGLGWTPLGQPLAGRIRLLTPFRGTLVANARLILNDGAWQPLVPSVEGTVDAAAEIDGELVVAGRSIRLFGTQQRVIAARYDGASWHEMGIAPSASSSDEGTPVAITSYNGQLLLARSRGRGASAVCMWNGEAWVPVDGGLGGTVIGAHPLESWHVQPLAYPVVSGATVLDGDLVIYGNFLRAGGHPSQYIARYRSCAADTDDGTGRGRCDGAVTLDDVAFYLARFGRGSTYCDLDDGSGRGTPDGATTIDDLLYYLSRFDAGC